MAFTTEKKVRLYARLAENIGSYTHEFDRIPEERKKTLKKLALFVESRLKVNEKAELTFICTHNSRRSHIAQIWAQTAAACYGIPNVISYSGGTEATAFNPRAVKAMGETGFRITKMSEGTNPEYEVRYADDAPPVKVFSKKYDSDGNPRSGFGAVMTCSDADQNCPIVRGAMERIPIPYEDPKTFDDTDRETEMYNQRVRQIGREILYAFSLIHI